MDSSSFKKDTQLVSLGILLMISMIVYRYWNGEDSYIRLHDYGEVYLPLFKSMTLSDLFSGQRIFDPFLGGIERNVLGSEFNIGNLMHVALPIFGAVILNELIIHIVAFTGLYLFLEKSIRLEYPLLSFVTAISFSVLPFYPPIYLSIAGLPLVGWALINISRNKAKYAEYIVCTVFPLYMAFHAIPGVLLFIVSIISIHWLVERRFSIRAMVVIIGMVILLFASEWRLFAINIFDTEFVSHRIEKTRGSLDPESSNYIFTLLRGMERGILRNELMHSPSYHFVLLSFSVIVTALSIFFASQEPKVKRIRCWLLMIAAVLIVSVFIRASLLLLQPYMSILKEFNMERIIWMYPPLMHIHAAVAGAYLISIFKHSATALLTMGLILYSGVTTFWVTNDIRHFKLATYNYMTYADFFAEPLFNNIHIYLKGDGIKRVVSVGINPGVALYNGFRTADGYWNLYDLRYKHRFRPVISDELAKNKTLQRYFDGWGHRVHMFYADQGPRTWRKPKNNVSKSFSYNTEALRELDVSHVFSAFDVVNAQELDWNFEKKFCKESIPYCIYLYSIES